MDTKRRIYLTHIRRLQQRNQELADVIASLREQYSGQIYDLEHDLYETTKKTQQLFGVPNPTVNIRRKRNDFYFVLGVNDNEKEIAVISVEYGYRSVEYVGLDFSVLDLSYSEIKAIKDRLKELLHDLELFSVCPMDENDLQNSDFSEREFKRILDWWALFDNEKEQIRHLYNFKYNDDYRQKIQAERKQKKEEEIAHKQKNNKTFIYLMKDTQTNFYKIGQSRNPAARESTLFSEKPCIELVCAWEAEAKEEKQLHRQFQEKQVRGEWFELNEKDIESVYLFFQDRKQFGVE